MSVVYRRSVNHWETSRRSSFVPIVQLRKFIFASINIKMFIYDITNDVRKNI